MGNVRTERHGDQLVEVLEDPASGSSARILAGYGFNCYSFRCRLGDREYELLDAAADFARQPVRASANGTPILFPFPNRIRGGRFEFGGRQFELPRNERSGVNAIHGLVIDRPWRVVAARGGAAAEVTGQFQLTKDAPELAPLWPADCLIEMTYRLEANRLTSRVLVTNPDSRPLPWGFGTHPYFRLPLDPGGSEANCTMHTPVGEVWELQDLLPTGRRLPVPDRSGLDGGRPLSQLQFDDVFTDLRFHDGWCTCRLADNRAGVDVVLRFDQLFRELVIYTPPRRGSICLEPYTCVTDAINLQPRGIDAGLRVLRPDQCVEGTIEVEARGTDE
jgi:aldose 1-epimerase